MLWFWLYYQWYSRYRAAICACDIQDVSGLVDIIAVSDFLGLCINMCPIVDKSKIASNVKELLRRPRLY